MSERLNPSLKDEGAVRWRVAASAPNCKTTNMVEELKPNSVSAIRSRALWLMMLSLLWGTGAELRSDQVIFSEIMHAPKGDVPGWIELHNLTATPLDIAEWHLAGEGGSFQFPPFSAARSEESFLRPFEKILLALGDPEECRSRLNVPESVRVFGPWTGQLGREQDRLRLRDKNGVLVCGLSYDRQSGWPLESVGTGHSLVIVDEDRAVDDASNWTFSRRLGGSPGYAPIPANGIPLTLTSMFHYDATPVFDFDSPWRYDDSGRELNPVWRRPGYDDSSWAEGKGVFGFEDAGVPSPGLQTGLRKGRVAYYFRKTFQVHGSTDGLRFSMDQLLDDGAIYYLNGHRIARVRMRAGLPAQNSYATETVGDAAIEADALSFSGEFLKEGDNVLAVQVHQATRSSSDLVFGCRLKSLRRQDGALRITQFGLWPGGDAFVVIENRQPEVRRLKGMVLEIAGENQTERFIEVEGELEPLQSVRIELAQSALPDDRVIRVVLKRLSSGDRVDSVPVSLPSLGAVQVRDPELLDQWLIKPLDANRTLGPMPRPGSRWLSMTEIDWSPRGGESWIELVNLGSEPVLAGSVHCEVRGPSNVAVTLSEEIAPGGYRVLKMPQALEPGAYRLYLKNEHGETLEAHDIKLGDSAKHLSRIPEAGGAWYVAGEASPGAPNPRPSLPTVVINEIMADPGYGNEDGEFLELYNFGEMPVDLSGFSFDDGIRYRFPKGTVLPSQAFLVLARNPAFVASHAPGLGTVHKYRGALADSGERLRLIDENGNLIDEVDYRMEGDWPRLAAGKGSSLELRHPGLDNSRSSAWADSREARKQPFRRYEFRGRYQEAARMGWAGDYRELHFYLVGESHVVLKNIRLHKVGDEENLLPSRVRLSSDPAGGNGAWLIQGNHADSYVEGDRLHLIAHGHGDNRANRAEIDVLKLKAGEEYVLSFDARWVAGSPRLIMHTWDNSFSHSFALDLPHDLGTPGRTNSRWQSNGRPQLDELSHRPVVPKPGQPVMVSALVTGDRPDLIELWYRDVGGRQASPWEVIPMGPVEDQEKSTGSVRYVGRISGQGSTGRVVEFYVRALNEDGGGMYLPRRGEGGPALVVFDDRDIEQDLRTIRFVVNPRHLELMQGWGNRDSNKYPRLSNQYFNATFISNESKVFYGAELRRSGSPWTRNGGLSRGKWKLPKDREFRGHGKFSFDDDPSRWTRHHNRMARYLLYLLGHPVSENEFVRVVINADSIMLREDVEPVDADFLNRNFDNGNDGELYRIDDQWWFRDDWRRAHRDATWDYLGSDHPAWYRNAWMKRSREEEDDYSRLIDFFKLVSSGRYSTEEMGRWIDSDQVMKMTAVMGFVGDWDSFTQQRGKNAYFYRRPDDGKFQFLQWDTDLAFQRDRGGFYGGNRSFIHWVERPENMMRLRAALSQLNDWCNKNPERVHAWIKEESTAHPETRIQDALYLDWFSQQERRIDRFLGP